MTRTDAITVYYDGLCPLCRKEVAFYRHLDRRGRLAWLDVAPADAELGDAPLCRADALARLHARLPDGRMVSGAAAFLTIWSAIPVLMPLSWLRLLPGMPWLLERGYRGFLKIRPWLTGRRPDADDTVCGRP